MEAVDPKQIAIQVLKTTRLQQCRFTNFTGSDGYMDAVCASFLLQTIADYDEKMFSPAFLVAMAYANDYLQMSFTEIAELIRKNIVPVDMTGFQMQAFRAENRPIAVAPHKARLGAR